MVENHIFFFCAGCFLWREGLWLTIVFCVGCCGVRGYGSRQPYLALCSRCYDLHHRVYGITLETCGGIGAIQE